MCEHCMNRRQFHAISSAGLAGSLMGLAWATADDSARVEPWDPEQAPVVTGRPLRVQPVSGARDPITARKDFLAQLERDRQRAGRGRGNGTHCGRAAGAFSEGGFSVGDTAADQSDQFPTSGERPVRRV